MVHSDIDIIAIIATKNRTTLLKERSLKSIYNQTLQPNHIIIIDDSDNQNSINNNISMIEEYSKQRPQVNIEHILNHRTKGAAGSWNSAIDFLLLQKRIIEDTFIAILDDDDEWLPDYINLCSKTISEYSLDMVACDFYRITEEGQVINTAPIKLSTNDFLIGNPGIQGSNIFIRLTHFLEAGCFDENIQSSTDRDLCIRITDLGTVKYKRLSLPLMKHFAESNRIRMSSPNTTIKQSGMYNFWLKHSKRMSVEQKKGYLKRAKTLFNWSLPNKISNQNEEIVIQESKPHEKFSLHIGVICSDYQIISPLLAQLTELQNEEFINKIQVFLLENNLSTIDKNKIIQQKNLLEITFITRAIQDEWIKSIDYFKRFSRNKNNMFSIAQSRTFLQKYLGQIAKQCTTTNIIWILDEDMQITEVTIKGLSVLPQLKKQGIDIAIGKYEYSSPNPPMNGIRVQLVDFWYNLNWLLNQESPKNLVDFSSENRLLLKKYPDYYYDLSRKHSGHLEHPFWLKPNSNIRTVKKAMKYICEDIIQIFAGKPLTRPLTTIHSQRIIDSIKDSVNRGGTTFIFNPEALDSVPNLDVEINGTDIRRSDMIWAVINKYYRKMNIKAVNIPIWHASKNKKTEHLSILDIDKVREEIIGSCLYASLTDFLKVNPYHHLKFTDSEILEVTQNFDKQLKYRMILLNQSFHRVRGISKSIQNMEMYQQSKDLKKLTEIIDKFFSRQNFGLIERNVNTVPTSILSNFLNSIQEQSDKYKNIKLL